MASIDLEKSFIAANGAIAKAKELGIPLTVSIVDDGARLVLTMRGDGTGFFTTKTSRTKAAAAAAFGKPTKDLGELQKTNPAFWSSVPSLSSGELLPTSGAVPLVIDGKIIGAIGCGGGTPDQDHECAVAGAMAIK